MPAGMARDGERSQRQSSSVGSGRARINGNFSSPCFQLQRISAAALRAPSLRA